MNLNEKQDTALVKFMGYVSSDEGRAWIEDVKK